MKKFASASGRAHRVVIAASVVLGFAQPAYVRAADRQIGGWNLSDDGKLCRLSQTKKVGDDVHVTIFYSGPYEVLTIGKTSFLGLENDRIEILQLTVGKRPPQAAKAKTFVLPSIPGGGYTMSIKNATLASKDLNETMAISLNGQVIYTIDLTGIRPASAALVDCGKKYAPKP